jgi:hypothetical protein
MATNSADITRVYDPYCAGAVARATSAADTNVVPLTTA